MGRPGEDRWAAWVTPVQGRHGTDERLVYDSPMARQRSEVADEAIIASTLAVIADRGIEGFSVEEVASRASVGKATIYRRYADRNELINSAIETLNDDLPAINKQAHTEDVLVDMLEWVRTSRTSGSELLPRIFAQAKSNPHLFQLCHERVILPRMQRVQEVLRLGVERGEFDESLDVEIASSMLVSPVLMFKIINDRSARSRRDFVRRLVNQALRGMSRLPTPGEDGELEKAVKPSRKTTRRLRRVLTND
jgi:AcrR family transcriptional regulator